MGLGFKVVLYKKSGVQPWRYKLVGMNGETLTYSEGYASRWGRNRAVKKGGFFAAGVEVEDHDPK